MTGGIRLDARVARGFVAFSRTVAWLQALLSLAVLHAWTSGADALRPLVTADASMRPGAALAGLLAAGSLLAARKRPRLACGLSLLVLLLGAQALAAHAAGGHGWTVRLPPALLPQWAGRPEWRMLPMGAVSFSLLGLVGMAVTRRRAVWLREACALAAIAISMVSIASFGLVLAEAAPALPNLPIVTAAMTLLLVLAWMSAEPSTGLTQVAVADSQGGALARRLILPTLLLPTLLTFLFRIGQSHLGISESLALSLGAVVTGGVVATSVLWVAYLLDRSERERRTLQSLRSDASTDGLTGLANRRAFDERLAQALRGGTQVGLLMLDLDHFKAFNDRFGHPAGDEVLRDVGRLLREAVRPGDLAARYGGEEFAVVLSPGDYSHLERVGQRILEAFRAREWPNEAVTASMGAAAALPGEAPGMLVRRADAAMYRSKAGGRDRISLAGGHGGEGDAAAAGAVPG